MASFRCWYCAALLPLVATLASAQTTIVDTLVTSSSNPVETWSGLYKVGQSFTATTSGDIASLTLNLTTSNSSATPVYSVELWSTDGQPSPLPASLLATFVSGQQWSALYSNPKNPANTVTFTDTSFAQNYSLVANTSYWLVVTSTSGSAKAWGVDAGAPSIGGSAGYSSTSGTWSAVTLSGPLGMEITVQSAVPEPATGALVGGLLALGFAAFARRRKQSGRGKFKSKPSDLES